VLRSSAARSPRGVTVRGSPRCPGTRDRASGRTCQAATRSSAARRPRAAGAGDVHARAWDLAGDGAGRRGVRRRGESGKPGPSLRSARGAGRAKAPRRDGDRQSCFVRQGCRRPRSSAVPRPATRPRRPHAGDRVFTRSRLRAFENARRGILPHTDAEAGIRRRVDGEDRRRTTLLPDRIEDYASGKDPVRVIEAFVAAGGGTFRHPAPPCGPKASGSSSGPRRRSRRPGSSRRRPRPPGPRCEAAGPGPVPRPAGAARRPEVRPRPAGP
jgi:hypothetical protein